MSPEGPQPIKLFYTYAHEDEPLHKELNKHLALLQRQGFIDQAMLHCKTVWNRAPDIFFPQFPL